MNREYHRWYSQRLHKDMELLVFGHAGARVLVFPTRDGRFYEYEDLGLVNSIAHKIDAGQLQLYCLDNISFESFYCDWCHPADKINRYIAYEEYILNEVLPFIKHKNPYPCLIAHGCSLGAYQAANIAFRHPHLFKKLCVFSGRYDLTLEVEFFGNIFYGYYDENIYYNTPTHFLSNLSDHWRIEALKNMDIVLTIGKEDPFLDNNYHLCNILASKGIGHQLYQWDGRAHRGRYWRQMAPLYL